MAVRAGDAVARDVVQARVVKEANLQLEATEAGAGGFVRRLEAVEKA